MAKKRSLLVLIVGCLLLWPPSVWSQETEDIEDENVSFEEFDSSTPAPKAGAAKDESSSESDEMTLEPLQGDEDQVTEIPEKGVTPPAAEAPVDEPTPQEMSPPPPSMAEPSDPMESQPQEFDDSPNLELEARLHDIYKRFNSKKLTDEEWAQLVGQRESEVYKIQRGDTLWSISQTFFNDGNYWPKIWQINSGITNPHLIQPGNEIRFLLGTESETPAFAVTEQSEEPVAEPIPETPAESVEMPAETQLTDGSQPDGTEVAQEGESPSDAVEIPPPGDAVRPILRKIPPSLPEWTLQRHGDLYDEHGIDFVRRPILDIKEKKYLEGFVDNDGFKGEGIIKEIEGGGTTAAVNQYVYVTLLPGAGRRGERFTVIKPGGQLQRIHSEVALNQEDLAYQYKILGEVRLEELLSTSQGEQPKDIFRALVIKGVSQLEKGATLVKGTMPEVSLDPNGTKSSAVTQIVGAQVISQERTVPLYGLVFLSSGSKDGLEEGQVLTIRANTKIRNPDSEINESYIPVGQVRIVRVGEKFATGIVVRAWDAIFVGDVTGDGKVLPPTPPERRSKGQIGKDTARQTLPEEDAEEFENEVDAPDQPSSQPSGEGDSMDDFDDLESE